MKKRIVGIKELSECLGLSVPAVRSHLQRNSGAVPSPFKLGRRLAWTTDMIETFLIEKETEVTDSSISHSQGHEPNERQG